MRSIKQQGGFTYLLLLIALSTLALSLLKSRDEVQMRYQAQQEAELYFAGIKSARRYRPTAATVMAVFPCVSNSCLLINAGENRFITCASTTPTR